MKNKARIFVVTTLTLSTALFTAASSHGTQTHSTTRFAKNAIENLDFASAPSQHTYAIRTNHSVELNRELVQLKEAHERTTSPDTLGATANHTADGTDRQTGHSHHLAHADLLARA